MDGLEWSVARSLSWKMAGRWAETGVKREGQVHLQGNCQSKPFQELAVGSLAGHTGHNASTASISSTQSDRSSFAGGEADTT